MSNLEIVPVTGRPFYLRLAVAITLALVLSGAILLAVSISVDDGGPTLADADPGLMTERLYAWDGEVPVFKDVTAAWGLDAWRNTSSREISGGVVIADVNRDGALDLVVAGGNAHLFLANPTGEFESIDLDIDNTVAVDAGDLDLDGWVDITLARSGADDVVIWGGRWVVGAGEAEVSEIKSNGTTTGLIIARLSGGTRLPDLLQIEYGGISPSGDQILEQTGLRDFRNVIMLPNSQRRSMAASVAELTSSGGLDIWITRDIGWQDGGDSLLDRPISGPVTDVAEQYGVGLEIDGMGVTLADLNGDGSLDAYLSDVGDNEILLRDGSSFRSSLQSGAARIRPPGSGEDVISSSWASGAADLNLDGILDLVVANGGFIDPVPNKVSGSQIRYSDPPALFLGLGGGRFADVWDDTGVMWEGAGRGMALGDLDGDLDTDIVIVTRDRGLVVLRNDVSGPAVAVDVQPGCLATGGTVEVTSAGRSYKALLGAPSFLGRHASQVVVGTGGTDAEVSVRFPHQGTTQVFVTGPGREQVVLACEGW